VLRWRTDLVAPGIVLEPARNLEDTLMWRASQWQWVPSEAKDDDDAESGEWLLRGYTPIAAATAAELLPEPLGAWAPGRLGPRVNRAGHRVVRECRR
jgi:hypothetical protein